MHYAVPVCHFLPDTICSVRLDVTAVQCHFWDTAETSLCHKMGSQDIVKNLKIQWSFILWGPLLSRGKQKHRAVHQGNKQQSWKIQHPGTNNVDHLTSVLVLTKSSRKPRAKSGGVTGACMKTFVFWWRHSFLIGQHDMKKICDVRWHCSILWWWYNLW